MTFQTVQSATLRPHPAADLSSLIVTVNDTAEAQDDALMQIHAVAKLAKAAIEREGDDATGNIAHALDAIAKLAATAIDELDCAMLDIRDYGARAGTAGGAAPFGRVESVEAR